ncbi:Protein of unknown function [Gryllus bimaculatus]|nr:Protein of unknown function [Gryllus bimaculatus]
MGRRSSAHVFLSYRITYFEPTPTHSEHTRNAYKLQVQHQVNKQQGNEAIPIYSLWLGQRLYTCYILSGVDQW